MRRTVGALVVAGLITIGLTAPVLGAARTYKLDTSCFDGQSQTMNAGTIGSMAEVKQYLNTMRQAAGTGPVDVLDGICEVAPRYWLYMSTDAGWVLIKVG